jgi:hypothetical protein
VRAAWARWGGLGLAVGLTACAGTYWPDEGGVAVEVRSAQNARVEEAFLDALTLRRADTTLPVPATTPHLQRQLRELAEALQKGQLSADGAQREAQRWGRAVYHGEVEAWVLDCREGEKMDVPATLTHRPTAVISFAAAHFRPRSLAEVQCAVIVVAASSAERVEMEPTGGAPGAVR